jgi:lipoprotein NlpI
MKIPSAAALSVLLLTSQAIAASGYLTFNAGIAAYNRYDEDEAIRLMTLAIAAADLNPQFLPTAYFDRGEMYLRKKNYDLAIADFTECLRRDPDYVDAYHNRGLAYIGKKRFDPAIADYTQAIRVRPDLASEYVSRASGYVDAGRQDLAVTDMSTAISIAPNDAGLFLLRADIYRRMNNFDGALADVGHALDVDDHLAFAYEVKGSIYRDEGKFGDALSAYKDALEATPTDDGAKADVALAQWEAGKFSDSAETFEALSKANASNSYWMLWLSLAREKAGKSDDDFAVRAAKLDAAKWPAPIIDLYLGKSAPDKALAAARSGLPDDIQNQECEANFYVAEWQLNHNAADGAKAMLMQASSTCPRDFVEKAAATAELGRLP